MKVSYLVTCCRETTTLNTLLKTLFENVDFNLDELVILLDSSNYDDNTLYVINKNIDYYKKLNVKHISLPNENDFGKFKNSGIRACIGDYIFQIDADECPSEFTIGENLHSIINANQGIECFVVPRLNLFDGVTPEHATTWGWRLSMSKKYNKPVVNAYDPQFRIFKNDYPRISYLRKLHEKIEGYKTMAVLPQEEDWCLLHTKTIEKQIETNLKYNKVFTKEENQGFTIDLKSIKK